MQALVVDDSRVMRTILTKLLTGLNFDVVQAGDGAEALAALDAGARPEVALVDWNMPVMDGLTFIKKVRQNPEYRDVVLMMVTTESEQNNIVRALAAGAHEYVIKPFTDEVIAEKLEMLGLIER
ncbi:response regulator [Kineosporia succinea]|uniref:Two-component system chemotaxis response regulator CheY n=1 Tax=Kineosporia succinea TaxID=84632 RepID=A0ABT9NZJ9_9ACTN|nr:response regulator [Kineosporia succinea]MDP9825849.1 two-component system chemotaxis response regulator CheY [Kineosporia succinea]